MMNTRMIMICALLDIISRTDLCHGSVCTVANPETWQVSGTFATKSSETTDGHLWQVNSVEIAQDLILDVEIINSDKIPLLRADGHSLPAPIVFIHGWLDSRLNWMTIIPQILRMDVNIVDNKQIIVLPTLRGSGDSQIFPPSSQFTIEEFGEDIIKLLDKLGFDMTNEKFNIIGHSMGGAICTYLTVHHSKNINKVVFMDTLSDWTQFDQLKTFFTFDEAKNEPTKQQLLEMAKNFNTVQAKQGWISYSFANILNRENVKADSKAARLSFNSLVSFNLGKELKIVINNSNLIKCLVLFGEQDIVPVQLQVDFASTMGRHGTIVKYEDCGHDPHYCYPVQVATKIMQFLRGINDPERKNEL